MNVLTVMVVGVLVLDTGYMKMDMLVGPVPVRGAKTPGKIRDAKTYHKPGSEIAANGLEPLELIDCYAEGNARKPEYHGASYMADTAEESYHCCFEA
jgi:hypothetical protein